MIIKNGIERNKLDIILTDLLPVEISGLFSFSNFYDFLMLPKNQGTLKDIIMELKTTKANNSKTIFEQGWSTVPLKFQIIKNTNEYRQMSIIQPISALNVFLFLECYQKDILHFFEKNHIFSIRYHRKNSHLYYRNKNSIHAVTYFSKIAASMGKSIIQQSGTYFNIGPFQSINAFSDSLLWKISNFNFKYYAHIDYKSCFDSIYTHSYKWIIVKSVIDSMNAKNSNMFIVIDRVLQNINGKQSNGIIVGPEFSRMMAEILLQHIDILVKTELDKNNYILHTHYEIFRFVDDIYICASEMSIIEKIISDYQKVAAIFNLQLNSLKLEKGNTPYVQKAWAKNIRELSDHVSSLFWKKSEYKKLPESEKFLLKSSRIPIDRLKDDFALIIKNHYSYTKTIVSYMLSTIMNLVGSRKGNYKIFHNINNKQINDILDFTFYIYSFFPSFEQTRKVISIISYIEQDIGKKSQKLIYLIQNNIKLYSSIFKNGNIFDLCDWFPFFIEYKVHLSKRIEDILIDKANKADDPIIWANILKYSKYSATFYNVVKEKIEEIIYSKLENLNNKNVVMHSEFWYLLIFHNCNELDQKTKDKINDIINKLNISSSNTNKYVTDKLSKLLYEYLDLGCKNPIDFGFFDWHNNSDFGKQISYCTYQRTLFRNYRKNRSKLFSSLD